MAAMMWGWLFAANCAAAVSIFVNTPGDGGIKCCRKEFDKASDGSPLYTLVDRPKPSTDNCAERVRVVGVVEVAVKEGEKERHPPTCSIEKFATQALDRGVWHWDAKVAFSNETWLKEYCELKTTVIRRWYSLFEFKNEERHHYRCPMHKILEFVDKVMPEDKTEEKDDEEEDTPEQKLEAKLSLAKENLPRYTNQLEDRQRKVEDSESELAALEKGVAALEKKLAALESELAALKRHYEKMEQDYNNKVAVYDEKKRLDQEERIGNKENDINMVRGEVQRKNDEVASLQEELARLKEEKKKAANLKQQAVKDKRDAEKELANLKK